MWDASIRPIAYREGVVDVEVRTRDVWTLKAGVGFGRSGGANKTSVGLHDSNFLGFGKDIELDRSSDVDRTSTAFGYTDRNLLGRKMRLDANYASRSDGSLRGLTIEKPFWAADDRVAWGAAGFRDERTESLYALGEVTGQFGHVKASYQVSGGLGRGTLGGRIHHWRFGWTYEDDSFYALLDAPAGSTVPDARRLSYPWIEYRSFRDAFVALRDLDKLGRTEDLNLGRSFHVRLGAAAPAFGSYVAAGVFEAGVARGFNPGDAQLLLLSGDVSGRAEGSGIRNGLATGAIRYYLRDEGGRVFHLAYRASFASRLDPENQLLLGGDNGLRGYPLRYAQGTSMSLLTVEERWYGRREYFKLFRIGAAAFFDVGRVSGHGDLPGGDMDTLRDVGVGLRFGQSRSAHAAMVHVDVAVPLDTRGTSISGTQLLITTGETF